MGYTNSTIKSPFVSLRTSSGTTFLDLYDEIPDLKGIGSDFYSNVNISILNGTMFFVGDLIEYNKTHILWALIRHFNGNPKKKKSVKAIGLKVTDWGQNIEVPESFAKSFQSHRPDIIQFNWENYRCENGNFKFSWYDIEDPWKQVPDSECGVTISGHKKVEIKTSCFRITKDDI